MQDLSHLVDHTNLTNASVTVSGLTRKAHNIVFTNWNNLNCKSVFVIVGVGVHVMADELLAVLIFTGDHGLKELHQRLSLALGGEEEVQALVMRLDGHTVLGRVVFDKKLLEEEQGLSLFCFLPHLNKTVPVILGLSPVTVWTHLISNDKLHHECLLQNGASHHLGLDLKLHLE